MAKRLNNCIVFTAQVNDYTEKVLAETNVPPANYAFRGSKGISNKANTTIIGCKANGLGGTEIINLTQENIVITHNMKNRMDGSQVGKRVDFEFNQETKRLTQRRTI